MYDDVNLIFDLDGTICPIKKEGQEYDELSPDAEMVEKMRWYKQEGARIIILTARNMNRYDGDLEKIKLLGNLLKNSIKKKNNKILKHLLYIK